MMGTPNGAMRSSEGEQGVAPHLVAVRSLLRSLPRCCCSQGFEYRFHHQLMSEVRGTRRSRFERTWAVGWAGAGLGFAAAFAVAVVAFDVTTRAPVQPQMAATPVATVPATDLAGTETAPVEQLSSEEAPAQLAADDASKAKSPDKDSLKTKAPTSLQEYPSQMVGTGSP